MIFCTTQDNMKYNVTVDGQVVGLWETYGYDPHLFNLITRTAPEVFQYEKGFEKVREGKRAAQLHRDSCFKETLEQDVDGFPIKTMLNTLTPRAMFNLFQKERPDHLHLLEYVKGYSGVSPDRETIDDRMEMVLFSMRMRCLQYEKYLRGAKAQLGNIVLAKFGTSLGGEDGEFLKTCTDSLLALYLETLV